MQSYIMTESPSQLNDSLRRMLENEGIAGISHVTTGKRLAPVRPDVLDLETSGVALAAEIAAEFGKALALRVRLGQNTPAYMTGQTWVPTGGAAQGKVIPRPFTTTGTPNEAFLSGYETLFETIAGQLPQVRVAHLSWYGAQTAELYCADDSGIKSLAGYSLSNLVNAHTRLVDVAASLPFEVVELPITGYSTQAVRTAVSDKIEAVNADRPFMLHGNALTDRDWHLWSWSPYHGYQMIWAYQRDPERSWVPSQVYENCLMSDATHAPASELEIHYASLLRSNANEWYSEALSASGLVPLFAEQLSLTSQLTVVEQQIEEYYR